MERQPYDVFLESWGAEMHSLAWTAPFPGELRERALHALRSGRWRAWSYARDVLGWSNEEAVLACRFIELAFLHWMRTDGVDREVLAARLRAAQERGRAELTLSDHAIRRADSVLEVQLGQIQTPRPRHPGGSHPRPPAPFTAMRTLILVLSLAAFPLGGAAGQQLSAAARLPSAPPATPSVVVTGDGEVLVTPDRAFLEIAVETKAPTAVAAAAENARLMATVSEAIQRAGVPASAISGAGYNVSANHVYEQGTTRQEGYRAANGLRIEMDRFDRLGAIIDAALAAGANRVSDVRYTTREASAARQRAIAAAVQRARTDAEAMARAAGGSLGPLLEITNVRNEVAGMYSGVAARGVREETSIAPRELFVRAVVVARWAFVQQ